MVNASFKEAVCAKFGCPAEQYEEAVFRRCLHWQARGPAWLLRMLSRKAFKDDFELIRSVAKAQNEEEVRRTVNAHRDVRPDEEPLLHLFNIRVSGRSIIHLAQELFPKQTRAE